ncbi:hypothetical protein F4782DRAFT_543710 [Xylaria castorea]|nr:hypothetical protein F4782DRAFT_543710 [Xylaria castorea]
MGPIATLVLLSALTNTVLGHVLPVDGRDTGIEGGQNAVQVLTSMTAYVDINWSGSSRLFPIESQTQCFGFDGTGWSNIISSVKVAPGFRCRLWDSNSCNGDSSADIYPPGATELGSMNDKTTSFKCYQN